jgi:hypothetical protein
VLLAERRPAGRPAVSPRLEPHGPSPGRRRLVIVACVALLGSVIGALLFDATQMNHRYDRSRHVLAVTRGKTDVVSRDLAAARKDLHIVTDQIGSDSTALVQDTSQLQGARSALSAAQAHVIEQAYLLNSLHTCLGGVEQALNALAVGNQAKAADALKWVANPCSAAVSASG